MKSKILSVIYRIIIYIFFAAVFWIPLYYLVRFQSFSENTALIAASIGIMPLLFLFVPAFQNLIERISSLKIQGVEIGFQKEIDASVRGPETEQVTLTIDRGREQMYAKADMQEFINTVKRYLPNPSTRLVISIDLQDGDDIYLPMVYYQSRLLLSLFDLRAFLFIDSRHTTTERHVLGTIEPYQALTLINSYVGNLDEAFTSATNQNRDLFHLEGDIDELLNRWQVFSNKLALQNKPTYLTDVVFRNVFSEHLEANIIAYPVKDYELLFKYLESSSKYLILIRGNNIINVRTIDRVAREFARIAIKSAPFQSLLTKKKSETKKKTEG
jgi:hypothetical protein